MLLTLFLATCCGYALWLWRKQAMSSAGPQPKAYPGALPFIGHGHLFSGGGPSDLWNRTKDIISFSLEQGGVISLSLGFNQAFVITDPDDCLTVGNACLDKHYIYNFAKPLIGQGLIISDVPTWKRDRKLLNPAFRQQILNGFIDIFNSQSRRLVDQLAAHVGKGPFRLLNYLIELNLETICQTVLGLDMSEVVSKNYPYSAGKAFKTFAKRFQRLWMHNDFLFKWTTAKREQDAAIKHLIDISSGIINKRRLEREKENQITKHNDTEQSEKFRSILDLLLDITEETNAFTDQDIREHIDSMIIAGYDTGATAVMYTMMLLGTHAEVQEQAYKELQEIFEDSDRDVYKLDLTKLVYLEAVIKESLRLYPIVPIIARNNDIEVKLKNYTLPAGCSTFLCTYGVHRHPLWGSDVEQFRPERWLDPASIPDNPNAFAPFGFGRRACIGKVYAMMSIKTILVHLLRRYKITSDVTKLVLRMDAVLKPVSGHQVSLELRK